MIPSQRRARIKGNCIYYYYHGKILLNGLKLKKHCHITFGIRYSPFYEHLYMYLLFMINAIALDQIYTG